MNILALESGADFWGLSVARVENEFAGESTSTLTLLATMIENEPRTLARELMARIGSTLDDAGLALDDLDALAVGIGPGSWTGLRIGLSAMKTLAQVRKLPIAGVPSFDPIAQAVWRAREQEETALLLVAAPCRPGELYGKIYECGEDYLGVAQSEWIGSPQLLADTLSTESLGRGLEAAPILAGAAAQKVAEIFQSRRSDYGAEYSLATPGREQILLELAVAGVAAIASGEATDPLALAPLYLAPSNAERNLLGR